MDSIICPQCGKKVEISQAITHQFREQISAEFKEKQQAEIAKIKSEAEKVALEKAKETYELQYKNAQIEAGETKERNLKLQEQILDLTKGIRSLKEKDSEREIEMQKQLLKVSEQLELESRKQLEQRVELENSKIKNEMNELQKQLNDTKKALEDAQKKADQGSQQLQGEVLELDLEQQLASEFATDEITPVPKGVEGADIIQKVCNKFGQQAGIILWETKRTKAWSSSWTTKLREDVRNLRADTAVLVSDVLPQGIDTFAFYENVWVTTHKYALPLAGVLRISMLQIAHAKSAAVHKDEKLEMLYQYLTDSSFRHRFEAQVEVIAQMQGDFEAEQRTMMRLWKKKEIQLSRMMKNLANLYGELQGILGSALPTIQGLDADRLLEAPMLNNDYTKQDDNEALKPDNALKEKTDEEKDSTTTLF